MMVKNTAMLYGEVAEGLSLGFVGVLICLGFFLVVGAMGRGVGCMA